MTAAGQPTAGDRPTVVFVLSDARRLGYQLRMNRGGAYLEQVRQAVALLEEAHDAEVTDDPEAPRVRGDLRRPGR